MLTVAKPNGAYLKIVDGHVHVFVVLLFGPIVRLGDDQHVGNFSVLVHFARDDGHRLEERWKEAILKMDERWAKKGKAKESWT